MPLIGASVKVGDAVDGIPIEYLLQDLARQVHEDAARHYHRKTGCKWIGFSRETNDRARFKGVLEDLAVDPVALAGYLAEWDTATRPVAVIHWFPQYDA